MKCRSFLYINREDRSPVVRLQASEVEMAGGTLNFTHEKQCVCVTLLPIVPLLVILLLTHHHCAVLVIVWLVALGWFCFHGAARDLKRYPGNPSAR